MRLLSEEFYKSQTKGSKIFAITKIREQPFFYTKTKVKIDIHSDDGRISLPQRGFSKHS